MAAAVIGELAAVSARLKRKEDGLRWTAPESWHITLQFLGNTDEKEYVNLVQRLRQVNSPPVPVHFEELGFFDHAGVFFADVGLTHELLALEKGVAAATELCGFVHDARPYHPHITLARSKGEGRGLRELKSRIQRQPAFTIVAEEFLLDQVVFRPTALATRFANASS